MTLRTSCSQILFTGSGGTTIINNSGITIINSSGQITCCDTISMSYGGLAPSGLYIIFGNCDQSVGGGELLNVSAGTWVLDSAYTSGTRSNYTVALTNEGTNTLSPDEDWYQVTDSRLCDDIDGCLCMAVFSQIGGSPSEADVLVGQGVLRN